MKKTITATFLIFMLILCLCACKNESDNTKSTKDFSQYTPFYTTVLDRSSDIIKEPKKVKQPAEGELGITQAAKALENSALESIGYAYIDINNDNVPELIIGTSDPDYYAHTKNEIYALYGLKNNIPTLITEGSARNTYAIMGENKLYNYGSSGAMHSIFATYVLSPSLELECEHYYFTHKKDDNDNQIGYFHNKSGEFDKQVSEQLNIRPEAFWNIEQSFADKTIGIEFTPFSEYK